MASIGTLVSQWDTQAPAPCHAIRTGRVRLLWLHAKGSFRLWDLIAIPELWLVTRHSKVGKIFFTKTYLIVLKHEENLFWKKVEKFFDLENLWPRLVLSYRNEAPKLRPFAMRSEQGESAFSDYIQLGVSAFGISLRYRDSDSWQGTQKSENFFSLKLISLSTVLVKKKLKIFWLIVC